MTFEKDFPSLKCLQAEFNMMDVKSVGREIWQEAKRNYKFVCVPDIEEHCLDKQRVRKVISDALMYTDGKTVYRDADYILKELGL